MPISKIEVDEYECLRCGYKWINRINDKDGAVPDRCAKCKTTNNRFKPRKFMASSERKSVKELHHAKSFGDVDYCYLLLSASPFPGTS